MNKCLLGMAGILLAGVFFSALPVQASEKEMEIKVTEGESFVLPDIKEGEIINQELVRPDGQGRLKAMKEGETQVVIRYRIKVEKKELPKEELPNPKPEQAKPIPPKEEVRQPVEPMPKEEVKQPAELTPKEEVKQPSEEVKIVKIPDIVYPTIKLENLPEKLSSNKGVTPMLLITDENLEKDKVEVILKGKKQGEVPLLLTRKEEGSGILLSLNTISQDDEYMLECTATDTYGNETKQEWSFAVNQEGTTFFCQEESLHFGPLEPVIKMENQDSIQILSCAVNGMPAAYTWTEGNLKLPKESLKQGKNRISVTVRDSAGNIREMEPWEIQNDIEEEAQIENKTETDRQEEQEKDNMAEIKKQQSGPVGIIFLLIGGVLVFWEKKIWYNDNIKN